MEMTMDDKQKGRIRKTVTALVGGGVVGFVAAFGFMQLVDSGLLGTLERSQEVAGLTGIIYLLTAMSVAVGLASPSFGARFLNVEDADELREMKRTLLFSSIGMFAFGLALVLAALAGPDAPIDPMAGLAGFIVLIAIGGYAGIRQQRHTDELMKSVSLEATSLAFYLTFLFGGGWALLAHLGFADGPAPLDWLTMFAGIMLVASFAICGRRGMLMMR